jgi:ketosteroid isomerase-like protein
MPPGPDPGAEAEVWAQEVAYWDRLKAGDLSGFLSLLHDDVAAWPDDRPAPVGKDQIFQRLVAILPPLRPGALTVELRRVAVRTFGDVGVVHFEAHTRLVARPAPEHVSDSRGLHVWLRTASGWKLIGGMSGPGARGSGG